MLTDPIADMLTRIRNAHMAHKAEVEIPRSKVKFAIAKLLEREGFIEKVVERSDKVSRATKSAILGSFSIRLKYFPEGRPGISELKRISTPGRRTYLKKDEIRQSGFRGLKIISTSRGILTGKEALAAGIGGEIICEVRS